MTHSITTPHAQTIGRLGRKLVIYDEKVRLFVTIDAFVMAA